RRGWSAHVPVLYAVSGRCHAHQSGQYGGRAVARLPQSSFEPPPGSRVRCARRIGPGSAASVAHTRRPLERPVRGVDQGGVPDDEAHARDPLGGRGREGAATPADAVRTTVPAGGPGGRLLRPGRSLRAESRRARRRDPQARVSVARRALRRPRARVLAGPAERGGASASEVIVNVIRYETFISRNAWYVSEDLQRRIRDARLLIAGCGIGSTIAETCLRLGFRHLTLVDKDRVEPHNLNRQNFTAADVGTQKVHALAKRLLAINPSAEINAIDDWVTPANAEALVDGVDIVVDTIDFLSLEGIVALHDAGLAQRKPIIAPLSAGWGAAAIYFPPGATCSFPTILGLPPPGPARGRTYVGQLLRLIELLASAVIPVV